MESFDLRTEIINYLNSTMNDFLSKKEIFIDSIRTVDIDNLSETQLINFTNDIKAVIDPIKTSISSIDFFINNKDFLNNESVLHLEKIKAAIGIISYSGNS